MLQVCSSGARVHRPTGGRKGIRTTVGARRVTAKCRSNGDSKTATARLRRGPYRAPDSGVSRVSALPPAYCCPTLYTLRPCRALVGRAGAGSSDAPHVLLRAPPPPPAALGRLPRLPLGQTDNKSPLCVVLFVSRASFEAAPHPAPSLAGSCRVTVSRLGPRSPRGPPRGPQAPISSQVGARGHKAPIGWPAAPAVRWREGAAAHGAARHSDRSRQLQTPEAWPPAAPARRGARH